jgi:hypothetical protein
MKGSVPMDGKEKLHNFALALQGSANEWRTWILKINIKDDRKTWTALKSLYSKQSLLSNLATYSGPRIM